MLNFCVKLLSFFPFESIGYDFNTPQRVIWTLFRGVGPEWLKFHANACRCNAPMTM